MSEWRECKLGEVINLKRGHDLPKRLRHNGNVPIISSSGISGFHNQSKSNAIGVVTGRYGTIGKVFLSRKPFWPLNTILYVENFKGNDEVFIYYFLQQIDWEIFNDKSAVPGVNRNDVHKEDISLPSSLPEQKAIAEVLSSLDDKIDLLHRQNKTLEQMAETLFRQWFVEEAGEDWGEGIISQFVDLNSKSITKDYCISDIEYLDTGSLTEGNFDEFQTYRLANAPSRAKRLVRHNDILISTVRPNQKHYGIIKDPIENLVVSTGFCVITCHNIDPHFIYFLLTNNEMTEYLHSIAEGSTSTYPSLKPADIGAIEFQLPPEELLSEFSRMASDSWERMQKNYNQIRTLQSLRDTLLPKLMSGEVRVKYDKEVSIG